MDTSSHKESPVRGVQRRRSSLDNSCLNASETFLQHLQDSDPDAVQTSPRRRLSLNSGDNMNTTFLAGEVDRERQDLDVDWHNSAHSPQPTTSKHNDISAASTKTPTTASSSEEPWLSLDEESESSLESDCDSFCDASVREQPNKEYLRTDLGASCWFEKSFDGLDLESSSSLEPSSPLRSPRRGKRNPFKRLTSDMKDQSFSFEE